MILPPGCGPRPPVITCLPWLLGEAAHHGEVCAAEHHGTSLHGRGRREERKDRGREGGKEREGERERRRGREGRR